MAGRLRLAMCLLLALTTSGTPVGRAQSRPAVQPGIAYLAIDLQSNVPLAIERPDRTDVPILPGSVVKVATLAAAVDAGVADAGTRILCTREVTIAGHLLRCSHPDLHRALGPAEALAHSCNVYFATIAARLPRPALDRALNSLGLPSSDPSLPVAASALGIEGPRSSPRRLLDLMVRVTAEPTSLSWKPSALALVREGLRGAAQYGTASALAEHGISAMAKTGTTGAGGRSQGIVVGVTPAVGPTTGFVLVASGGAGMDAAALAAERLRPAAPPARGASVPSAERDSMVRIGVAREDGGYTVRTMRLEEYVAGVVAGEAAPSSPPAALEALSIAVRSFTLANRGRHKADGFDLCDLTHCQVLRGAVPATTRAAAATAGRVLLDRGEAANVFYTASCGGVSERPSHVWNGAADPSFLPSRADEACGGAPHWTSSLSGADLLRALRTGGFRGDSLRDMRVASRWPSGRVAWLRIDGLTPHEISAEDLRTLVGRVLGWQHIRSTMFDVTRTGAGFRIDGHGAGHGVGLCVIGASALAARGMTADAILARYYPGLPVSSGDGSVRGQAGERGPVDARRYDEMLTITLPDSERSEQAAVRGTAGRVLERLATRLNAPAPAGIELRFHPTVDSYRRETGQPWFTAAATTGTTVNLIPLSTLRSRRILESTLAHELAHILTASALAGRPRWVLEGTASYFSNDPRAHAAAAPAGATRLPCPDDREFQRPMSEGALRRAYADASACVARQLEAGTGWRDVR